MIKERSEVTHKIVEKIEELKQEVPDTINHFLELSSAALKPGALESRIKTLIALAIAITQGSEDCIVFHIQNLVRQKITYAELMEVIAITTYMGGGVALAAATHALACFQQMEQQTASDNSKAQTSQSLESAKGYES